MTSPDLVVPEDASTGATVSQLQNVTKESAAEAANAELIAMVQNVFDSIIDNLFGGFLNGIEMIEAAISEFLGNIVNALTGSTGGLSALSDWSGLISALFGNFSALQSFFQDLIDGILQTLRGIPVVGASLSDMLSGVMALKSSQDGTVATIGQMGGASLAASPDSTADYTLAEAAATGTVSATATSAPWAIIRITQAAQKTSLMWLSRKVGAVTSFRLDVYRIDPATGVATRLYTTDELVSLLSGSDAWAGVVIPPIIMQRDDVIGVQCRMVGAGSVVMKGLTASAPTRPARPYLLGAVRDPSTLAAPDTVVGATMDTLYVSTYPMIHIGSLTSFTAAPGSAPRTIADYFSSDLSSWYLTSTTSSKLVVTGGQLSYGGGSDGFQSGIYQLPLSTDDWDCQAQLMNNGVSTVAAYLIVASDATITKCVALQLNNSGAALYTITNGLGRGGETSRATGGAGGAQGGVWIVTYRSASATYRVYKDDTSDSPVLTWADTSGVHPTGQGQRYFGLALGRSVFNNAGPWDNFIAKDVAP